MLSIESLKLDQTQNPTPSPNILVMYPHLNQFPTQVELHGGWWSTRPTKNKCYIWLLQIKKQKKICLIQRMMLQSSKIYCTWILEETCLAIFSTFLIENLISSRATPWTVKDKKWKFACVEGQPKAWWKYPQNEDIPNYKMQAVLAWET